MRGTAEAAPPPAVLGSGLEISGLWSQRAAQKSRALVRTYLLSSSVPTAGGSRAPRSPLRLPSLSAAKGPRRQSSTVPLSLHSEPALLTPGERAMFEGFSRNCRPSVLQKRPPLAPPLCRSSSLTPCKTCNPSESGYTHLTHQHQAQSCSRPVYIHFSQAIQPSSKPLPARRYSQPPALTLSAEAAQGDLRPLTVQHRHSLSQAEALSVVGKPCLPSCSRHCALATASAPARAQLHVFLPTEGEGEELDSESVDEGFMDELDSKIMSLKLQQGEPKTLT